MNNYFTHIFEEDLLKYFELEIKNLFITDQNIDLYKISDIINLNYFKQENLIIMPYMWIDFYNDDLKFAKNDFWENTPNKSIFTLFEDDFFIMSVDKSYLNRSILNESDLYAENDYFLQNYLYKIDRIKVGEYDDYIRFFPTFNYYFVNLDGSLRALFLEEAEEYFIIAKEKKIVDIFGNDFISYFKNFENIFFNEIVPECKIKNIDYFEELWNYCKNHLKNLGYCF